MADEIPVSEAFQRANTPEAQEPVRADTVNLTGSTARVEARVINVNGGGIGAANGEVMNVTVSDGGIGAMAAKRADVHITGGGIAPMPPPVACSA